MTVIDFLINKNIISSEQLAEARKRKHEEGQSLITTLLDLGFVEEEPLQKAFAKILRISVHDIKDEKIDYKALELVPNHLIRRHSVLPLRKEDNETLCVAMYDPTDIPVRDELREVTGCSIKSILATRKQIKRRIEELCFVDKLDSAVTDVLDFSKDKTDIDDDNLNSHCAILNVDKSPVVQLVDNIIATAVKEEASDIHIEPLENSIEVRYRIDGSLRVKLDLPRNILKHLISRVKIMASLDISECRRPQDGRIKMTLLGKKIDLRLSTMQTVFGEKIVLRVLDAAEMQLNLAKLGIATKDLSKIDGMIRQPQGMVLVCGPTGSGKTSTLYSILNEVKCKEKNIMTIEDPVEYTIEGINQIHVNEKIGLTFSTGLRSILRQDPDILLVGEIRDRETAEMAFRASLTGHLVFSTLHTNCAISCVTRLRDIGIEPFLIASSILGIISQRLIRLNCAYCKIPYSPPANLVDKYRHYLRKRKKILYYKGEGCSQCNQAGYKKRSALVEILPFNTEIRRLVNNNDSEDSIRSEAKEFGFRSIIEEGIEKVRAGLTTLEELENVLGSRDDSEAKVLDEQDMSVLGEDVFLDEADDVIKQEV